MLLLEPLMLAPKESLLPNGTSQLGPPAFFLSPRKQKQKKVRTLNGIQEIYLISNSIHQDSRIPRSER